MKRKSKSGWNFRNPPIRIAHAELERLSEDSDYKSKCVKCPKGVLLVRRDQKTFELIDEDCCLLCGQIYIYTDIERLKKREGKC
jgi:NAD-dependent dihydropyrimidine dehydrogenase PreA subunit